METNKSLQDLSVLFYDKGKILKFFADFRDNLLETHQVIESQSMKNIINYLTILEKSNLLESNVFDNYIEEWNNLALTILEFFCLKYEKIILSTKYDSNTIADAAISLDAIAYLLKMFISEVKGKNYIEVLIENLYFYFQELRGNVKQSFTNLIESDSKPLCYYSLKFLNKILKTIPCDNYCDYISDADILQLIEVLPFSDSYTVKLFINYILPVLFQFSSPVLKEELLKAMWSMICFEYNKTDSSQVKEIYSFVYTMSYCICDYIYNQTYGINIYLHNEILFWKIILSGLTSSFQFTRKKALNVFKMFLLWINRQKYDAKDTKSDTFFLTISYEKDIKIWNDVITIFECLEEKQIHVIKPVLPKFSRILLLISKDHYASDENTSPLLSAWIMALINRMLTHETKFIARWAITNVFSLEYKKYFSHEESLKNLLKILLEAINDQSLFSRNNEQDNYSLFLCSEKIHQFLENFLSALGSDSRKVEFMRYILSITASQSWSIIPLLHFTIALSSLENTPSWNQSDLPLIRKIIVDCQRSHEPTLRSCLEYFLMECCTRFMHWASLQFEDLVEILSIFKSSLISRHSTQWNKFVSKLSEIIISDSSTTINKVKAVEFCNCCVEKIQNVSVMEAEDAEIENVELERVVRILLMLGDCCIISTQTDTPLNWISFLDPIISIIHCASKRPYLNNKKFLTAIHLMTLLIKEDCGCNKRNPDSHISCIVNTLFNSPEILEFLYRKLFTEIDENNYIFQSKIILEMFHTLLAEFRLLDIFQNMIPMMKKMVVDVLENVQLRKSLFIPLWKILITLFDCGRMTDIVCYSTNYDILLKALKYDIIQECLLKPQGLDNFEKLQLLQYSYESVCDFWNIASKVIVFFSDGEVSNLMLPLVYEVQKALNSGPKIAVPCAINSLKQIIPKLGNHNLNMMSEILEASSYACLELRGNEAFRPALSSFIGIIFQEDMFQESFFPILDKYYEFFQGLSENTFGIFYTFIKQFCSAIPFQKLIDSKFNSIRILVQALTFGPIHQKAHRITEDTLIYISEKEPYLSKVLFSADNNKPTCYVRITVLKYLLENLKESTETIENFAFTLISKLMEVNANDDNKSTSHFANSLSHRVKHRAWQSILLIHFTIKDKILNEKLLMQTLKALEAESQQPSIRYYQEWVIFNIILNDFNLINKFIVVFEESLSKRPSYIVSIISVTNILILHNILKTECDILKCFKLLTIFCMAQNFTVRLYAQLTLTNLYFLCQKESITDAIFQYEFLPYMVEMQASLAGQGNFFKNIKRLSNDFYFSSFNPISHFTLETIFFELPRLSNLTPEEWIKPDWFKNSLHFPIYNKDDKMKKSFPTSWSSKATSENYITDNNSLDYNFQKKIMPVKDILEGGSDENINFEEKQLRKDGLIVVASLIDRIPNLGGLCRTCEVFGVSEFVIASLQYTDDQQFQNLSVSADKWVTIKEVKPHVLKEYLKSMKEQGYELIGVEQTEDSCNLKEFEFPKKSLLLLGHEKEGLPVDLIQLLDICVEIPQQGVVRSLNVHVSGAILIWEYARQHGKSGFS
ncbi:probable methyltransferase TARBP1 [Nephila pilipes]|uniref:tRNA (guanosine(18)-2'-O)-methyltransferase TARBP1 n=1 Tax=Nephila pilipes TaxID=299642 RepID=A0A8X6PMZ1_NEPPI|nr:probable methyltransferase TARBP1 [Nephila pilipes]